MCNIFLKLFFILLISDNVFSQGFITVDKDTNEFIENVNFFLYKDGKPVSNGITMSKAITTIRQDIPFDSISFTRIDYETIGFPKRNLDSIVFLSKRIVYLDEVVLEAKKDEILLGESNRFIKRSSRTLSENLDYGLIIYNGSSQNMQLRKIAFYVERVNLKTAYKINFSEVSEIPVSESLQVAEPGDLIYSTDTLYLNPKDKERIEVLLPDDFHLPATKKMFAWIQLLGYYDAEGGKVLADSDKQTRLKFQISNKTNYYSRMFTQETQKMSPDLINLNLMFNYDYAFRFFTTPPKGAIVAPAIVLYAQKVD